MGIAERSAPDSWNWKDQGAITSIKDQQQCGSCAAFAAVAAADSCMWMASNSLYDDLSEQPLDVMVPGLRLIMTGLSNKMMEDLRRKTVLLIKQKTGPVLMMTAATTWVLI